MVEASGGGRPVGVPMLHVVVRLSWGRLVAIGHFAPVMAEEVNRRHAVGRRRGAARRRGGGGGLLALFDVFLGRVVPVS